MLNARRLLFEAGNALLRPAGLCISRVEADFQTSKPKSQLLDLVNESLVAVWGQWYEDMMADPAVAWKPKLSRRDFTASILDFLKKYQDFAGKNVRTGGLFLNNSISLFAVARFFGPATVIDSGTHTGNSAWTLHVACPRATVHSFDLTHVALSYRTPSVQYHLSDWAEIIREPLAEEATFGFFDDHVDQIQRIEECRERNVRYLLFDDDVPVAASHTGHNVASFPKISWAFSEAINRCTRVEWTRLGKSFCIAVDHERLKRVRELVQHYSRLPDLFPFTGCRHQWPLSLVILRPAAADATQAHA